ncbi:MAG: hypothetical protein WBA74_15415 [Cyclobacteriaceae bacterium]
MKKLLIVWSICMLWLSGAASAQSENYLLLAEEQIPYKLEMNFYKHFKKAQNVKWYKADGEESVFKAVYNSKQKSIAIVYESDGTIMRQEFSDRKSKIPEEVVTYFERNYQNYKLIKLSKVYVNAAREDLDYIAYYKLTVKKDDKELALQFKEDHDLFKGKNYIEAPAIL